MSDREKRLAVVVGLLGALVVIFLGYVKFNDGLINRQNQLSILESRVETARVQKKKAMLAKKQLNAYLGQSLPGDRDVANLRYNEWIRSIAANCFATPPAIKPMETTAARFGSQNSPYHELSYSLNGQATLDKLIEFLHQFYAADELHRIQKLSLTRGSADKAITVAMTIDALAVPGAIRPDFGSRPAARVAVDLAVDREAIVNRNVFAPANKGPEMERIAVQRIARGERLSVEVKARDPDDHQLRYELVDNRVEGVEIDEKTGRIRWLPEENGNYEFTVKVRDNGFPPKEATRTMRVTVTDPRPREQPAPREAEIDKSQFAFVCGITDDVGKRQEIMLNLRTENKTTRYTIGDKIDVGPIQGVVARIEGKTVEITTSDGSFVVELGQSLADGRKNSQSRL